MSTVNIKWPSPTGQKLKVFVTSAFGQLLASNWCHIKQISWKCFSSQFFFQQFIFASGQFLDTFLTSYWSHVLISIWRAIWHQQGVKIGSIDDVPWYWLTFHIYLKLLQFSMFIIPRKPFVFLPSMTKCKNDLAPGPVSCSSFNGVSWWHALSMAKSKTSLFSIWQRINERVHRKSMRILLKQILFICWGWVMGFMFYNGECDLSML